MLVTLLTSQLLRSALKEVLSSNALYILVTLLTSQLGIAPYWLFVHKPSTGFVLKHSVITALKLLSVIGGNTVTICVAVAVFPEPSVTVQVTVVSPTGKFAWALLVTVTTVQLSAVAGVPKATLVAVLLFLSTLTITFSGGVMVGLIVSASKLPSVIIHTLLFVKRSLAS